jgi:hypothetical protein
MQADMCSGVDLVGAAVEPQQGSGLVGAAVI